MRRTTVLLCTILLLLLTIGASPAGAAVAHDDKETAHALAAPFPFFEVVDLRQATTSDLERQQCPGLRNGVWYKFTAEVDSVVLYSFQSRNADFVPVILTIVEDPGSTSYQCFQPGVSTQTQTAQVLAGGTAYLAVGAERLAAASTGLLTVYADVRPLVHLGIALAPTATVNKAGELTVAGTVGCDAREVAFVRVSVTQKSGHGYLTGDGAENVRCEPESAATFQVPVRPLGGGKFTAGKVSVSADASCSAWAALCTAPYLWPTTLKVSVAKT